MEWYYAIDGQQQGPVDNDALRQLVAAGTVNDDTPVWHDGMDDWAPYGDIRRQTPALATATAMGGASPADADPTPETAACCECGRLFPVGDLVEYENLHVCAACKPTFFQRVREGAAMPGAMLYGGFWIRAGAKIIDGIVLGIVSTALSLAVGLLMAGAVASDSAGPALTLQIVLQVIQFAIALGYTTFFLGRYGATPGKMACRLRVVRPDGSPLTYGRACGRYFGDLLSNIILCIGYLMAAFDDEKRTLHDRLCDTRVVKV